MESIRIGRVSSINPATCSARVTFRDRSEVVSYDMPVIVRGTLGSKDYWMPEPDELVLCALLVNGRAVQGFVLGSFYSKGIAPPASTANKRKVEFDDGTTIEYDTTTHVLSIVATGAINIQAAGDVHVTGDVFAGTISLKHHTHSGGGTGQPV